MFRTSAIPVLRRTATTLTALVVALGVYCVGTPTNGSDEAVGTSEKVLVELIRADKAPEGVDEKYAAAIRRVDQARGQLGFDDDGNLIGVDLASDRVSASDADIPYLRALPHLKKLRLSGGGVTNAGIEQIASITGLGELFLSGAKIDDVGLDQLAQLPSLGSLTIRRSPKVTDRGLEHLKRFPKLVSLGLLEVSITDRGLERLKDIPRLRAIDLRGNSQITNSGLTQLGALKDLRVLRLGGYQINHATLAVLATFTSLNSLTIDEAAIKDAGLASLAGVPLEEINLYHCFGITDNGFQYFGNIATLRQFTARAMPLTGRGLKDLCANGKLTVLRLNETGVNDAALEQLRGLTSLIRLELRQTPITDDAVDVLSTFANLEALDISQTRITEKGAVRLGLALPHCKITVGPK